MRLIGRAIEKNFWPPFGPVCLVRSCLGDRPLFIALRPVSNRVYIELEKGIIPRNDTLEDTNYQHIASACEIQFQ